LFKKELNFFIKNQSKLVQQYAGRFIVLRGAKVVDVYDSALEAYLSAKSKFEPGTFMIQPCIAGGDAYTVSISSANTIFE